MKYIDVKKINEDKLYRRLQYKKEQIIHWTRVTDTTGLKETIDCAVINHRTV